MLLQCNVMLSLWERPELSLPMQPIATLLEFITLIVEFLGDWSTLVVEVIRDIG